MVLIEEVLPAYATDAKDLLTRIMDFARSREEDLPVQDGFDLYHELVEIRRVNAQALPG